MVRVRVRGGYSNAPPAPPLRLQHGYHLSSDAVGVKYLHTAPAPAPPPPPLPCVLFSYRGRGGSRYILDCLHTPLLPTTAASRQLLPRATPPQAPTLMRLFVQHELLSPRVSLVSLVSLVSRVSRTPPSLHSHPASHTPSLSCWRTQKVPYHRFASLHREYTI